MNLRFNIRLNTGKVEVLNMDADRVLIGSGGHCEIRLNVDQARIEHIRIDVVPQGIYATALSFEPPPTINGVPFTQAPLPPDAILGVGQTQIQVQPAQGVGPVQQVKKKQSSPLMIGSLLTIMLGVAAMFLFDEEEQRTNFNREVPELFAAPTPQQCKQQGPTARNLAFDLLTTAESKRERRAFYPQDGVQAVADFEQASACFRAAGEMGSVAYCDEAARKLRDEMNGDFRKFRERLRYHYNQSEWASARYDVKSLLAFTENMQGGYREFLKDIEREIAMRAGQNR